MLSVRVFNNGIHIGDAELYAADPPMGVAAGPLKPTTAYDAIRSLVYAVTTGEDRSWNELALEVATEDGEILESQYGIVIWDLIDDPDNTPPELVVMGLNCANGDYEKWFGSDPGYLAYYGEE